MAKSASGKYQGSLSLEWFNKQKAVLLLGEEDAKKEGDIPAPRINWINRDDALFYEIDEEEGKGLSPYWVDRNDIRVKEARPLVFKKAYVAEAKDKKGSLPGMDVEYRVKESKVDDPAIQNWLIKGDNLLALNALKRHFEQLPDDEKIQCICIDPPYNTGSAFSHYDDGMEHSLWLTSIRDRVSLLWDLLSERGSLWIIIGDEEAHYLKVMCDGLLGRECFVTSFAWEKDQGRRNDTDISTSHDHILLYAKNRDVWKATRNLLPRTEEQESRYKNPDGDPRGPWLQGDNGTAKSGSDALRYPITTPSGRVVRPPVGNYWRFSESTFQQALKEGRVYFGLKGDGLPLIKRYLTDVKQGVVPRTWWPASEFGSNQQAKRDHLRKLLPDIEPFSTPKPEKLIERILHIATDQDGFVLDCFLGSGTIGAVATKMKRRWIGIEIGDQAESHIIPRLKKVMAGEDPGGVTEALDWHGGGSFKYYHLGPSIIHVDKKTGKGEFNWKLGREFLQESLLQSYDFMPDAAIKFSQDLAGDRPAIGRLESPKGVIFGVAWLVAPDEPAVSIDANTVQALYNTLKEHGPRSIHVFTNKGWDIKQDAMPPDMEIIKVPHAIFAELER